MSLINQMLKDLEKRRATAISPDGSVLQGVSWPGWRESQSRYGMTVLLLGVLCIAIGAAGFVWYQGRQDTELTVVTATPDPLASRVAAAKKPDMPLQQQVVVVAEPVETIPANTSLQADLNKITATSEQVTTVASIEPVNISASQALAAAETRPVERSVPERVVQESATSREDNNKSTVTKTPRPQSSEQQAEAKYQRALNYYRSSQYSLAEPALRKTLALDVGHIAARELLIAMLIKGGRHGEVDTLISEGLDMFPQRLPLIQLKSRALMLQGNTAAAIQVLEQNEPAVNAEPAFHALRAALYQRNGQHQRAVEVYTSLVSMDNATPAWWIGLAISQEALGQIKPALESYRHAAASKGLSNSLHAYVSDKIRLLGRR